MAIPAEEAGQADLRFSAIAAGAEADLLPFDVAPQRLHWDVVKTALLA
jgi:hypothetical protein